MLKPALLCLVLFTIFCDVTWALPSNPITNSFMSEGNHHDPDLVNDVKRYRGGGRPSEWGNSAGAGGAFYNSNTRGDDGGRAFNNGPTHYNTVNNDNNNRRNDFTNGGGSGQLPAAAGASSGNDRNIKFPQSESQMLPGISSHLSSAENQNRIRPQAVDPNKPVTLMSAFTGCETHENYQYSTALGNNFEIKRVPLKQNSHIAVYPLTDKNPALYVKVMMPSRQYKARVQGSNVHLMRCSNSGTNCVNEDVKSTKASNLIVPQQWNYVYSQIKQGGITIGVGETVEVMSMSAIPREELENAEWLVSSSDGERSAAGGQDGGPFVVQYPCSEYVANHLPNPEVNPRPNNGPGTGFPGSNPNFPGSNPNSPGSNPNFPGSNPNFPGSNPNFPGSNPNSPDSNPNFPGSNPNFPGSNPNFPGSNPNFPGSNPNFPGSPTFKPNNGLDVDATHSPPHFYPGGYTGAPIIGHTSDHPSKAGCNDDSCRSSSTTSAIVLGVIVAVIIVLLVAAIGVSVYKKRQAAMINENTPLSEQKAKQEDMEQQVSGRP